MRRLVCEYYDGFSFGAMIRQFPEMRGTLTDLLIGDLFDDRVDKVWAPLESLYKEGKKPIPTWDAGSAGQRRRREGQRARAAGGAAAVTGLRRVRVRGAARTPTTSSLQPST